MTRTIVAGLLGLAVACTAGADTASASLRQQAFQDPLPALARSHGFFPGLPDDVIVGQGRAVCYFLQDHSIADLVAYETSIGLSPATGMHGTADLLLFAADATAYCPDRRP